MTTSIKHRFLEHLHQCQLLGAGKRLLVAVSGGVDSIVLLNLLLEFADHFSWTIGVVHINHQLRLASNQEAEFVRQLAQEKNLSYYEQVWEHPLLHNGIEEQARKFRYQVFVTVMQEENYDYLLTAHHGDDQLETQLMKWTRGNFIANLAGINPQQAFGSGFLVRPLLIFAKQELYQEAKLRKLTFFEDASNQNLDFFRNRIRNSVLPLIKAENNNLITASNRLNQQIRNGTTLIKEDFDLWQKGASKLNLTRFLALSQARQYYYLLEFFQQEQVFVKFSLLEQILTKLRDLTKPNLVIKLANCNFVKNYDQAYFDNRPISDIVVLSNSECFTLNYGERFNLTKREVIVFGSSALKSTDKIVETYYSSGSALEIRHPKSGDRIKLSKNLTKKLARVFIDEKISQEDRRLFWVILDQRGILFLPQLKHSYFSKRESGGNRQIYYVINEEK